MREIDRSDNEKLRYKRDIMKAFITERFFNLDPDIDIIEAYTEYEKESMQAKIEEFATLHNLDESLVAGIVTDYFMDSRSLSRESIRLKLRDKNLGLLAMTKAINEIMMFAKEMSDLYTAEGI